VFISFISRKAEELEQNLSPNHMVCGNTRFFKSLTTTLDVAQGFPLLTEGAVRGLPRMFVQSLKPGGIVLCYLPVCPTVRLVQCI
jgi:hypothetical protein